LKAERLLVPAFLLVAVLAVTLRFHEIGAKSYWIDELWCLQQSNGYGPEQLMTAPDGWGAPAASLTDLSAGRPLREVVRAVRTDNHPPLYFFLLRFWRETVGEGETRTRALSALFSLVALALLAEAVRSRHGPGAALWAALLMAVSGLQVFYAQQLRGYTLAMALVTLATLAVARLEAGAARRPWALTLFAATLAALLSHYFALGPLLGLGVYALVALRGATRRATVAALVLGAAAFALAWGPMLLVQRSHVLVNNAWAIDTGASHGSRTLLRWLAVPENLLSVRLKGAPLHPIAGLVAWLAFGWIAWRESSARLWLAAVLGSTLFVMAVDLALSTQQLQVPRYTLMAAPAALALVSVWASRLASAVPALVVVLALVRLPDAYLPTYPPWRGFAEWVVARTGAHQPVLLVEGPHGSMGTWTYQALRHYAPFPRLTLRLLVRPLSPAEQQRLYREGTGWVLAYKRKGWQSRLAHVEILGRSKGKGATPTLYQVRFLPPRPLRPAPSGTR
jgi:uncharacterized membrane protein